jgi:hypothetical protein
MESKKVIKSVFFMLKISTKKIFKIFSVFLYVSFFYQCTSCPESSIDWCEFVKKRSAELIYNFYNDNDTVHLDSALNQINEAIENCEKYSELLSYRKLSILSLKHEYQEALLFIKSTDDKKFNWSTYSKTILYKRFQAMQSQYHGNIIERNDYLDSIIKEIEVYIILNQQKIDSIFIIPNIEEILKDTLSTTIIQYYYYRSIMEGINTIEKELTLKQEKNEQNKDFFEVIKAYLQEDFMIFIGI